MRPDTQLFGFLHEAWAAEVGDSGDASYVLCRRHGVAFAAHDPEGRPALVIELAGADQWATGRRATGCDVLPHQGLSFDYDAKQWEAPAAVLINTDPNVFEAFAVLAADVVRRLGIQAPTWGAVVELVEEWQMLLAPKGAPSIEHELGLWGELWVIANSLDAGRSLIGWRGPELDRTDFFIGASSLEVKTSRTNGRHHVSQDQVDRPVGAHDAWLLSLWVKADPLGVTVPTLVTRVLDAVPDPAEALKRLARGGYSPADEAAYTTGLTLLAEPAWYPMASVPRVRVADPEVSQLRYSVTLPEKLRVPSQEAARLFQHFLGRSYGDFAK